MTVDGWTIAATIATSLAALATGTSAVYIAKQTKATNSAVVAARHALKVASVQAQQSLRMVSESIKARLEAKSPSISTTVLADDGADKYWTSSSNWKAMKPVLLEIGANFNSPQQDDTFVWASRVIEFHNDGPGGVDLQFSPPVFEPLPDGNLGAAEAQMRLAEGESVRRTVMVGTTVGGWIEACESYKNRSAELPASRPAQFVWSVLLPSIEGVAQYQRFEYEGSILNEMSRGQWHLGGTMSAVSRADFYATAIRKTYILDAEKDDVLPEPEWAEMIPPDFQG